MHTQQQLHFGTIVLSFFSPTYSSRCLYSDSSRPPKAILSIVIHRIRPLAPIILDIKRNECLVRCEQRSWECVAPVDTQPRTGYLHPTLDISHRRELAREDLAKKEVHPRNPHFRQPLLDQGHSVRVSLAAQRAQDETPFAGASGCGDGVAAERLHLIVAVGFARELPRVRVVPVRRYGRVVNHDALQVESAISEVQDDIYRIVVLESR